MRADSCTRPEPVMRPEWLLPAAAILAGGAARAAAIVLVPLTPTRALVAGAPGAAIEVRWEGEREWRPLVEPRTRYAVVERESRWRGGELRDAAGGAARRWEPGPLFEEWAPVPVSGGVLLVQTTEVSNRHWAAFLEATGREPPPDPGFPGMRGYLEHFPEHPAVLIGFAEARAYCAWRDRMAADSEAGAGPPGARLEAPRLPTAAEWRRAAEGLRLGAGARRGRPARGAADPVDRSRWGVWDLGGNVAEWCADRTEIDDPSGAAPRRVVKGGSWADPGRGPRELGYGSEELRLSTLGMRTVRWLPLPESSEERP